ncbi:MAG: hypothetical protein ABIK20_01095, partial [Candidatus Omnitrophota bacterium]
SAAWFLSPFGPTRISKNNPGNWGCGLIKKFSPLWHKGLRGALRRLGYIVIEKSNFVSSSNALLPDLKECPFAVVCKPKNSNFIKLNPPKSISILGQTGWESAKTRANEGGGGLMS